MLYLFVGFGLIFGLFYSVFGDDIFIWNSNPNSQEDIDKKVEILKNRIPWAYKAEAFFHRFLGVFLGWMIAWVLLDLRLKIFSTNPEISKLNIVDFFLFLFAWVGINGRLPTIPHTIQNWFDPTKWFKG